MKLIEAIKQLDKIVDEIRQAVFVDDKTPLKNALGLREESALIDKGESEFEVVFFGDLNRFKGLNDQFGHDAGDVAILKAGEKIHQIAVERYSAKAFRQSGDEFVILLKKENVGEFLTALPEFEKISFSYEEKTLITAMSFGYAVNDDETEFIGLLKNAETACQIAKNEGDGICIKWTEDIERNALVNFRDRCQNCNAKISCNVPKQNAPEKLKFCPACGANF